jgi:hypothetical protein
MKTFFLTISLLLASIIPAIADETYFPYPQAPDEIQTLSERSNYIIYRFWDRCNFSSAFMSIDKMKTAFIDYVNIMPYASNDTVQMSINGLLAKVNKQPKDLLALGQIAEETLHAADAEFWSDELYLLFAHAVVNNKKISKADKAPFKKHIATLENCQPGKSLDAMKLVLRDGSKYTTDSLKSPLSIIFIESPNCSDCRLTRVKLAANASAIRLINAGKLQIISLSTVPYSQEWAESVSAVPSSWLVATSPEADDILDIRNQPEIYILGANRKLLIKHATMEHLIPVLEAIP